MQVVGEVVVQRLQAGAKVEVEVEVVVAMLAHTIQMTFATW